MTRLILSRRTLLGALPALALPGLARATPFQEITWDDLIPAGVPYGEIVGPGVMDEANDTWSPEFDENGSKLNTELDGRPIRLPGYIIPFDTVAEGVTTFMLVPYVGACIHTPPPPPNQLVFVSTAEPWPNESLWDAIWVEGRLSAKPFSTAIGEAGYQIASAAISIYEW